MASNNFYDFVKDYSYEKSGFKVNEKKHRVIIYSSTSAVYWILGFIFLALGVSFLFHGELLGLVSLAMGLIFFGGLTKRTVFDLEKKEIRREVFFISMTTIVPQQILNYHTTAVTSRGRITSYVFGLQYGPEVMKGIAAFDDIMEYQKFQGVITRILGEMKA